MDIVNEILEREQQELAKYKPITVEKLLEVQNDLGLLLCTDVNDLAEDRLKSDCDDYLLNLTRDNVQLLLNDVWQQPTESVEESVLAKLPAPVHLLPRERKVPDPKPLTKWQKFAQEKGIKKKPRMQKTYDDVQDKWVPTYGYKRAAAEKERDWVLEVPGNADPMEDQFQKKKELKKERVAKNELQRMRNVARAQKLKIPRVGITNPAAASSKELLTAATVAKASTASVGKFQDKLPKDKKARGLGVKELIPGVKRKASHLEPETKRNLDVVESVLKKRPKVDVEKAISLQKRDDRERRDAEQAESKPKRSKKGKSQFKSKGMKKPRGGKGQRNPNKRTLGRKRR
ncbi:ribosome biogenesis regulatory protein homolog [Phlebotomus argentipes]|uniref:ribosome biogenesis regulatory protein homolog n=1 Tax=Phlebotomus argentipes TaxID=94469 RepID=UPI002892A7F7|nr:ribosome biogenesis regulatory protein homolog [Phlebotomus argentipes]XP_059619846.1 ribosome biogenesis regulatory protein homolog [Phlebotomus argentipes]